MEEAKVNAFIKRRRRSSVDDKEEEDIDEDELDIDNKREQVFTTIAKMYDKQNQKEKRKCHVTFLGHTPQSPKVLNVTVN